MGIDISSYRARIGGFRCRDPKYGCRNHYQTKHAYFPYEPWFSSLMIEELKRRNRPSEVFFVSSNDQKLPMSSVANFLSSTASVFLPKPKRLTIIDIDTETDESAISHDLAQEHLMLSGDIETNPGPTERVSDLQSACVYRMDPDQYDLKSQCISFMLFCKQHSSLQSLSVKALHDIRKTLHEIQARGFNESLRELVKMKNFFCFSDNAYHVKSYVEKELKPNMNLTCFSLVESNIASYAIVKEDDYFYLFSALKKSGPSTCSFSVYANQSELMERICVDNKTKEIYFLEYRIEDNIKGGKGAKSYKRAVSRYSVDADVSKLACSNGERCIKALGNDIVTNSINEMDFNPHDSDSDVILEESHIVSEVVINEPPALGNDIVTNSINEMDCNPHDSDSDVIIEESHIVSEVVINEPPITVDDLSESESHQTLSVKPPGLVNLGNTCYMNSIIQCFNSIISMDIINSTTTNNPIDACLTFLLKQLNTNTSHINPTEFRRAFILSFQPFDNYAQQDSHEFLMAFIDHLHGSNFANGLIQNKVSITETSIVECDNCGNTKNRPETNLCLSLPLPNNTKCAIEACLHTYFENEHMTGDNRVDCTTLQCRSEKQNAVKCLKIVQLPEILIIHLNRFHQRPNSNSFVKNHATVSFPFENLSLAEYCSNPHDNTKYSLFAISNHSGNVGGGHYTAHCKKGNNWFDISDTTVRPITPSCHSNAYILFYKKSTRIEQCIQQNHAPQTSMNSRSDNSAGDQDWTTVNRKRKNTHSHIKVNVEKQNVANKKRMNTFLECREKQNVEKQNAKERQRNNTCRQDKEYREKQKVEKQKAKERQRSNMCRQDKEYREKQNVEKQNAKERQRNNTCRQDEENREKQNVEDFDKLSSTVNGTCQQSKDVIDTIDLVESDLEISETPHLINECNLPNNTSKEDDIDCDLSKTHPSMSKSCENSTDFLQKYFEDQKQKTLEKNNREKTDQARQSASNLDQNKSNKKCRGKGAKNSSVPSSTPKQKQTAQERKEMKRQSMAKTRQNKNYVETENTKEKKRKATLRQDEEYVEKQNAANKNRMNACRQDEEYVETENTKEKKRKATLRQDEEYVETENTKQKKRKATLRQDKEYVETENTKEKKRKATLRQDEEYVENENVANRKRKATQRLEDDYVVTEKRRRIVRKHGCNLEECKAKFKESISNGPVFACTCCQILFFRNRVVELAKARSLDKSVVAKYSANIISIDGKEWICTTCRDYIKKGKSPKYAGVSFPIKPPVMELNKLEERCVSSRIPFMMIYDAKSGRQKRLRGSVANVPIDVQPLVNSLPRTLDESKVLPLKLKRKLAYNKNEYFENIHPKRVRDAAKYLVDKELYIEDGITFDDNWDEPNQEEPDVEIVDDNTDNEDIDDDNSATDGFIEAELQYGLQGNQDTMIDDANVDRFQTMTIAPGEGNCPMSLFQDKNDEYKSFPSIFCGESMKYKNDMNEEHKIHYSDQVKWELFNQDGRARKHITNIFYKAKKLQIKQVKSKAHLAMKRVHQRKGYTVSQVLDSNGNVTLNNFEDGYKIFKSIRNSPAYLEDKAKEIRAMIRQLGIPTWFISLSANDLNWPELLVMLGKMQDGVDYTGRTKNLSYDDKTRLVRNDPVTCARFFQDRVDKFISNVLKSEFEPIGKIQDFVYRVEFQHRCSPHIHMLMWIEGAPTLDVNTDEEIINFLNKYVSCSVNCSDKEKEFVELNRHKHTHTCKKGRANVCRFDFPLFPMKETAILRPYSGDDESTEKYTALFKCIRIKLQEFWNTETEDSIDEFMTKLDCTYDEYLDAIRTSVKTTKVFLKRSLQEIRINPYMTNLVDTWQANHDIQFVIDPFACARYITDYITKASKGVSTLMKNACEMARNGDKTLKAQVYFMGDTFLNAVEIGAQEAVYLATGMALTKKTRDVEYINTGPEEQRVRVMKEDDELKQILEDNPNSTDIYKENFIIRYAQRPQELENYCLADYVAKLNRVKKKGDTEGCDIMDEHETLLDDFNYDRPLPELFADNEDEEEDSLDTTNYDEISNKYLSSKDAAFRKRTKPRVIRYRRYDRRHEDQIEDYYREQLMLFKPWRIEDEILPKEHTSYKDYYEVVKDKHNLDDKRYEYDFKCQALDIALREAGEYTGDSNDVDYSTLAPGAMFQELRDENGYVPELDDFYNPNVDASLTPCNDLSCHAMPREARTLRELRPGCCSQEDYYEKIQKLNSQQREFLYHIYHWVQTKEEPFHIFLSGGAGVGKSVLIDAAYETLQRFYIQTAGDDETLDYIRILITAFTGTAAFNVGGKTMHTGFKIYPHTPFTSLTGDKLHDAQSQYRHLKLIIIDEISLISNKNFVNIYKRLQQFMNKTNKAFGNVSILLVGDLFQLEPVGGKWIFMDNDGSNLEALMTNLWQRYVKFYELTEIMRQKDDQPWAELLNRLREGLHTTEDVEVLRKLVKSENHADYPTDGPHLFRDNDSVNAHNDKYFDRNGINNPIVVKAKHIFKLQDKEVVTTEMNEYLSTEISGNNYYRIASQLVNVLKLDVDLRYVISKNVEVNDGLTNGALGTLKHITSDKTTSADPDILWILFDKEIVGRKWRNKHQKEYARRPDIERTWTPIFAKSTNSFQYKAKDGIQYTVMRKQFPITLAAAVTYNKAQSRTITEKGVCNFKTKRGSIHHMHYTGLSRFNAMQNVVIQNLNEDNILTNEMCVEETIRLRNEQYIELCYLPVYEMPENNLKLVYHNISSLRKHIGIVKRDRNYLHADVLGFSESRFPVHSASSDFSLDGFHEVIRNDLLELDGNGNSYHGTAVYVRNTHILVEEPIKYSEESIEWTLIKISNAKTGSMHQIGFVYIQPNCGREKMRTSLQDFADKIDYDSNYTIMGDFNVDESNASNVSICSDMQQYFHSQQLVRAFTTIHRTRIDLVFGNIPADDVNVISSMISDHSIITAQVKN